MFNLLNCFPPEMAKLVPLKPFEMSTGSEAEKISLFKPTEAFLSEKLPELRQLAYHNNGGIRGIAQATCQRPLSPPTTGDSGQPRSVASKPCTWCLQSDHFPGQCILWRDDMSKNERVRSILAKNLCRVCLYPQHVSGEECEAKIAVWG